MTPLPKFLIVRFSSIGDIVLTTPVIRALKNKYPESEIHFVTKKAFCDVVRYNPSVDKVHLLDGSLLQLVSSLKHEKFTHIVDLHHNLRSLILKLSFIGVKSYTFKKLNFKKWLYISMKRNVMPDIHIVERYLNCVRPLGVVDDGGGLDFYLPPSVAPISQLLPQVFSLGYISIVAGAKHFTKRIPPHRIVELCLAAQLPIVLLGGPEDMALGERIADVAGANVVNAGGKLTLTESAMVIKNARMVISSDTGLMHIAAAYGRTILSLWGNTTPALGMYPFRSGKESEIFEVAGLPCRPCSKIGFEKCPKGHFKCMENIDYAAIHERIKAIGPTA